MTCYYFVEINESWKAHRSSKSPNLDHRRFTCGIDDCQIIASDHMNFIVKSWEDADAALELFTSVRLANKLDLKPALTTVRHHLNTLIVDQLRSANHRNDPV